MKTLFIVFIVFINYSYGQSLAENKIDEFTKNKVIRTSWEPFCRNPKLLSYISTSRINNDIFLSLKFMGNTGIFSVNEGNEMMLKLSNDSIISLRALKYAISCRGCGSVTIVGTDLQGVNVDYKINEKQFSDLLANKVIKIRIYTADGYFESDIKEKFAQTFIKELELIK